MKIKEELLRLNIVVDNIYLDKYVELFNSEDSLTGPVQKHHFIPVYYYKNLYNINRKQAEYKATEDENNTTRYFSVKTRVLLHFYLEKCSVEPYQRIKKTSSTNNTLQLHTYTRRKSQEEVHKNLSESHKGHVPSNKGIPCREDVKQKIAASIKGRIWINNGNERKQIKKEDLELYIKLGYIKGYSKIQK